MTANKLIKLTMANCMVLVTAACVDTDMADLRAYTESVLARPGGRIDPLPNFNPPQPVVFAGGDRDPFMPFHEKKDVTRLRDVREGLTEQQIGEVFYRKPEELEKFELDSLRMTGVLKNSVNDWGLVRDPDGIIHRVQAGNYLGRNFGKIVDLYDNRIELREIVQDSRGVWHERAAGISLSEN